MRTYHRSFFFWFRWLAWLLILLALAILCLTFPNPKQPVGSMFGAIFTGSAFLFSLYLFLKTEPYAIRVYSDRFMVCFVLSRKEYLFADVADISLDAVQYRKSGAVKSVRVEFRHGRHLQLPAINNRQQCYDDLHTTWRASV